MSAPQTQQHLEDLSEYFETRPDEQGSVLSEDVTLSHNHGVALEWIEYGKPVFPCDPTDKRPLTPNGFKNASTDTDQVNQWWTQHPDAAVGLPTGCTSGIIVVDVDVKGGQPGRASVDALIHGETGIEQGAVVNTPSGGWHYFFEQPTREIRCSVGKKDGPLDGIDIRADGGYVIAPGSRMANDKDYEPVGDVHHLVPLPAALEAVITASRSHQNPQVSQLPPFSRADVQKAESALAVIDPDCPYDTWTNIGMALHHRFGGDQEGLDIWERWSAGGQKWKDGETTTKWQGFSPDPAAGSPITIKTLYSLAKKEGWRTQGEAHKTQVPLLYYTDERDRDLRPDWIMKGMFESNTLAVLVGEFSTGKTFLGLDLACSIASFTPWLGHEINKPGLVIYVLGEGRNGLLRRIRTWEQVRGRVPSLLLITECPMRFTDPEYVAALQHSIDHAVSESGHQPVMVVIDTLERNLGDGSDSDPKDMTRYINGIQEIRERYKCCVLTLHHPGHSDKGRSRGVYAFEAAMDAKLVMENKENPRRVKFQKSKEGELKDDIVLDLVKHELTDDDGNLLLDEKGEPITSCVLEPSSASVANVTRTPERLSKTTKIALIALEEAIDKGGMYPPTEILRDKHTKLSTSQRVVKEDDWRSRCYRRGITSSEKPEAKRQAFNRARSDLREKKRIDQLDGYVWITPQRGQNAPR